MGGMCNEIDWEAVGAVGTWVVGLVAFWLARLTYRRDHVARVIAIVHDAQKALTHVVDVFDRTSELRQTAKTLVANLNGQGDPAQVIDALEHARSALRPVNVSAEERSAIADAYAELKDVDQCVTNVKEILDRQRFSIGRSPITREPALRGDIHSLKHAAIDLATSASSAKKALGRIKQRLELKSASTP